MIVEDAEGSKVSSAKVSVVTVCRNPGPIALEAIKSVHEQLHPAIEHIVVDGNSTDGTPARLESLLRAGDILISEPDEGVYDAMNKGIAKATGEFVALLNADDRYADPGVLARVIECFERTKADAVFGDVTYFRAGGDRSVRRFNSGRFRPSRIGWGWMPVHPAMVLTKDAYDRVGPYRTDFGIAADFEFVARAFSRHRLRYSYMREVFVNMRCGARARSVSRRAKPSTTICFEPAARTGSPRTA